MLNVVNVSPEQAAAALADSPALAERHARALIAQNPGDPRPRLILASAMRRLGRAGEALPALADLAQAWPRAARTRYELGLCLAATGKRDEGLAQLQVAVQLDPRLTDAWGAIADHAFASGASALEQRANVALAGLRADHPDLARAAELVALERHDEADPILRRFCRAHPHHAEAARLLAACLAAARTLDAAETLLRHALTIEPRSTRIRFDLAATLFAGRFAENALAELAPLLAAEPENAAYLNLKAACLGLIGDDTGAEAINAQLARAFPGNARIATNHGHAARTAGKRDIAIAAYRRAIALCPQAGEPWWGLANLKIGVLTGEDEAAMDRLLAGDLPDDERMRLSYALARRLEDTGKASEAFPHYAAGAILGRKRFGGDGRDYAAEARRTAAVFGPEFLAIRQGWGAQSDEPIFIVGLPRSGSTLVEQILASHSMIEGTMELPYIGSIASQIAARGPDALERAGPDEVRAWGEQYLERARIHRRLGRPYFLDKMPNNFRHIGLIQLILPRARIIDVRRAPMAACFSCFKQLFAEGQEFSYDLTDLGHYYRHYLAIIRHFDAVDPGAIHTLIYEDLIDDTEGQVRQLLDACGVAFEPGCLRFFENNRAVRTVSSEQVRQPIYRSGLDQWQAFAPWLGPLENALGDAVDQWRR